MRVCARVCVCEGVYKGVCVGATVWMMCPDCHLLAASGWLVDSDLDKWAGITLNADRDLEALKHCNHAHMACRYTRVQFPMKTATHNLSSILLVIDK